MPCHRMMPTARTLEKIAPLSFILSSGRKGTTYVQGNLMYVERYQR